MDTRASTADAAPIVDNQPRLEEYDLLLRGEHWVALSAHEAIVVRLLLERPGRVVAHDRLTHALWPTGSHSHTRLYQLIVRVRRRIEPLGMKIGTVRGRGYVLRIAHEVVRMRA